MAPRIIQRSKQLEPWQDPTATPYIEIDGLVKNFGPVQAVKDVSISIYKGEFFSLLGGSGCGKTTLLRMLAGFEKPTHGHIYIDGVDITNLPAYKRPVNMMFQSYALFPHMSVFQNIAFGLQQDNFSKSEIYERVIEALKLVRMESFVDRKPHQMSGGQCQRVALARSLVKRPKLLLLDEPLAALDKNLREQTQFELVNIQESLGVTFIMVTHDQEEAMTMSTRMAIMDEGYIRQIGAPHDIYEYPQSRYVAEFIGSTNIIDGVVSDQTDDYVEIESPDIEDIKLRVTDSASLPIGTLVGVAIRPEKVKISLQKPHKTDYNCIKGTVKEIAYLGDMSVYYVEVSSGDIVRAALPNLFRLSERDVKWDDEVYLTWSASNSILLSS
ncbi:MAG: polyamine ABC transporter ATP-binding protein [Alphaproteobacteria bacterium]|nr:polyamine ABC transporter ATP-binding protein [Alphaproteobacteria bacterium]